MRMTYLSVNAYTLLRRQRSYENCRRVTDSSELYCTVTMCYASFTEPRRNHTRFTHISLISHRRNSASESVSLTFHFLQVSLRLFTLPLFMVSAEILAMLGYCISSNFGIRKQIDLKLKKDDNKIKYNENICQLVRQCKTHK